MSVDRISGFVAAGESHRGCVRAHNEDNFFYDVRPSGYCFAAVADGVGGHSGGEVASYLCCHRLLIDWKELFKKNTAPDDAYLAGFLADTINTANYDIYCANLESRNFRPMCTTLAAAIFTPRMVLVAHVGDSRVYCCRDKFCRQITVDHTVLNEMHERGFGNSVTVPGAHVISRALGTQSRIKAELHSYFHTASDRFLLCTDGLTYCWNDSEIAQVMSGCNTPREVNSSFLRTTLRRGAADNITVVSVF